MKTDPWRMTPKQYHASLRSQFLRENPEISGREYDECMPFGCYNDAWLKEIYAACDRGEVIPAIVIDRMCDILSFGEAGIPRLFRGQWEQCLPEGYVLPSAREKNKRDGWKVVTDRKARRAR